MSDEPDELPLLAAPRTPYYLVTSPSELASAIEGLVAGNGPLAVDAERASGFRYHQSAYLVQLHRKGSAIYLIDPVAFVSSDLDPLRAFMNQQEWILHAATQDLPCLNELGLHPKTIFDTELISRLLGFPRVGLGAICELALGVRLAKEHSAADWSTRPLPDSWLTYAALDVDVLPDMREFLIGEIAKQDKQELVAQEMANLLLFKPKPAKIDKWRSMSNLHQVKEQRGLAVAKELWEAREALAKDKDTSPGRILPDVSIVTVSTAIPRSKSELAGLKTFIGRGSRTYLDIWWKAIEKGAAARILPPLRVPATGIPNHRSWESKFPEAYARLAAAKEVIAVIAEANNLPVENLLTPDILRELCFDPSIVSETQIDAFLSEKGAREWQRKLVVAPLAAIFSSREEL